MKNFPTAEQAIALLGPGVRRPQWQAWDHYWALQYQLPLDGSVSDAHDADHAP